MLYEFRDTTEYTEYPISLPAQAMQFNGKWIESEIPGYRTLYVTGRETISAEITDTVVGAADGSLYERRRYEPRTLIVGYQLIAKDNDAFCEAFNKLNGILNTEQAQISFNDELDKYYIGTKTKLDDIPSGVNAVTGEIEIYCADPFKYSVTEFTAKPNSNGVIEINYEGTYPSYPAMDATMTSDNGYISYIDESNGATLLAGNQSEVDGEDVDNESELLINKGFYNGSGVWILNQATLYGNMAQNGTLRIQETAKGTGVTGDNWGTGTSWHGIGLHIAVPEDSTGYAGAQNFCLEWKNYFGSFSAKELGMAQFVVSYSDSGEKKPLAGIVFVKNTRASLSAIAELRVGDQIMRSINYTCNSASKISGSKTANPKVEKSGGNFRFTIGGKVYEYSNDDLADAEGIEVDLFIAKYASSTSMARNTLIGVKFYKYGVNGWVNLQNQFSDGQKVTIDCSSGEILIDDEPTPGIGALGNNWENFKLNPGVNNIACYYSDFAQEPDITLRYREVYL